MINPSIKDYYQVAFVEKEGLGTAYEYYAKNRIIQKYIKGKNIKNILIVGLPEKYGYSMDFFILGDRLNAEITVIENRDRKIAEAKEIIKILQAEKILSEKLCVNFHKVENFMDFSGSEEYDFVLSCGTLQRVAVPKDFINYFNQKGRIFILFCPNGNNQAHNLLSGLKSIPLVKLKNDISDLGLKAQRYGYIDFPPFPPGIRKTNKQRKAAKKSLLIRFIMSFLTVWCLCEKFWPSFIKKRLAHIIYFVI